MGVTYRKSVRLGKHTRLNMSEHGGVGFSTGFKGFRISKNRRGIRLTIGGNGIHYTKWFMKNKKHKHKHRLFHLIKKLFIHHKNDEKEDEKEKEEEVINPETDFERVPTEDEKALLLYIGEKAHNIPLFAFLVVLIGAIIYSYLSSSIIGYLSIGLVAILFIYYLFFSKLNYYLFGLNRSIKLFGRNKFDKAYAILTKCLTIKPHSEKALILMMFTTFELKKYEETIEYVERFKKDYEPLEVMHFMEGYSYNEVGKYEKAISSIEKVYSEEKDIKYSKYKILGDCFVGLGDYHKALNWYRELPIKGDHMDDTIMEYKYAIGKAYLLDGDKKKAFHYLSKVYDYKVDYKDVKDLMDKV